MSDVSHRTVSDAEDGMRFDRWAKKHYPALSFGDLQRLLRTGQFRLDGKRVKADARVASGQDVRVPPPAMAAAGVDAKRRPSFGVAAERDRRFLREVTVHEDERVLVINKPAGLAVQGGSKTTRHVDGMLGALGEGDARPRLVHRLDRDTSGLLVLAKGPAVARELVMAFQQHRVRKLYWAIVLGRPERDAGVIDLALSKSGPAGGERVGPGGVDAKRARTGFRVVANAGKVAAWVGLLPLTGRTHQLRAHCAAIGNPIMGDAKYGSSAAREGRPAPQAPPSAPGGLMLHARAIELPLSNRKQPLSLEAPPPKHLLEGLRFFGLAPEPLPFTGLADWDEEF